MGQKIFNKRSSVITDDGSPKLPSSSQLDYGEIAINYADGAETISLKNSANEIVEFKSKEFIVSSISNVKNELIANYENADTVLKNDLQGQIDSLNYNLTKNTTNDTAAVTLTANDIVVFTAEQTFSTKTFNIAAPNDTEKDYTWTLRFKTGNAAPTITFNPPSNYTIRWANGNVPTFAADTVYEITFKCMPTLNIMLGVWGGF